jgi:hypothetical protein
VRVGRGLLRQPDVQRRVRRRTVRGRERCHAVLPEDWRALRRGPVHVLQSKRERRSGLELPVTISPSRHTTAFDADLVMTRHRAVHRRPVAASERVRRRSDRPRPLTRHPLHLLSGHV